MMNGASNINERRTIELIESITAQTRLDLNSPHCPHEPDWRDINVDGKLTSMGPHHGRVRGCGG